MISTTVLIIPFSKVFDFFTSFTDKVSAVHDSESLMLLVVRLLFVWEQAICDRTTCLLRHISDRANLKWISSFVLKNL